MSCERYIFRRGKNIWNVRVSGADGMGCLIRRGWTFEAAVETPVFQAVADRNREMLQSLNGLVISRGRTTVKMRVVIVALRDAFTLLSFADELMEEDTTFSEFTFLSPRGKRKVVYYPHESDFYVFGYTLRSLRRSLRGDLRGLVVGKASK